MTVVVPLLLLLAAAFVPQHAAPASPDEAFHRLDAAVRTNYVDEVKRAIQAGANLNAKGGGGQTPIMAATLSGSAEVVRYLLQEHRDQIDLSIGEKDGYTPMHGAGFQGRAGIGRLLIRAGLNPSDRHQDGVTPIHRACWGSQQRHTDTVRMFLEDGKVDVNELANGQTPLDSAYGSGNDATVALLNSKGGKSAADLHTDQEL